MIPRRLMVSVFVTLAIIVSCQTSRKPIPDLAPSKEGRPGELLKWSEPVNGLRARIEKCIFSRHDTEDAVFVRVQNVCDKPLLVPASCQTGKDVSATFQVYGQSSVGSRHLKWHRISLAPEYPKQREMVSDKSGRKRIRLEPGQSALIFLYGYLTEDALEASTATVSISVPQESNSDMWYGVLNTPPHGLYEDYSVLSGKLPFPDYFPAIMRPLTWDLIPQGQLDADPNTFVIDWRINGLLRLYKTNQVVEELSRRMLAAQDRYDKMRFATILARLGNETAKEFILDATRSDESRFLNSSISALALVAEEPEIGEWAIDRILDLLSDKRTINFENCTWFKGAPDFPVWYVTSEHLYDIFHRLKSVGGDVAFGKSVREGKYRKAVIALASLAKREEYGFKAISPLGIIGDPAAVPHLIEILNERKEERGYSFSEAVKALWNYADDPGVGPALLDVLEYEKPQAYPIDTDVVKALGACKVKEAMPVLVKYMAFPEVAEALGEIGDRRAIEPLALERLVANNGRVADDQGCNYAGVERQRRDKARVALALLKGEDVVPGLAGLLEDKSISEYTRCDIVRYLALTNDTRVIEHLVKAIREDPAGSVTGHCIGWLSNFKSWKSIRGLIDSFDVDFSERRDWMPAYTPMQFKSLLAESLRKITGEKFGADKGAWENWWDTTGEHEWTKQSR